MASSLWRAQGSLQAGPFWAKRKHGNSEGCVVPPGARVAAASLRSWAGRRAAAGRGRYNLVDVSLFMPLRWARLEDSTGSSRGAWGVLFRAK